MTTATAPPGWYEDPVSPGGLRYFDGHGWTAHTAHRNEGPVDPGATEALRGELMVPESPWRDLAQNRAGEAARRRARQLQGAAPFRTFVQRLLGRHTEERSWRIGADGEEEVGRRLRSLGAGWRVLHSVPVGPADRDIDHVVIGPPGVFTLNTKHVRQRHVWVAERAFVMHGQRTSYLPSSRAEGERAAELLSAACGFLVTVVPVIVAVAANLDVKTQPPDVFVVGRRNLVRWLKSRPPTLGPEGVEAVFERARRDSTWRYPITAAPH